MMIGKEKHQRCSLKEMRFWKEVELCWIKRVGLGYDPEVTEQVECSIQTWKVCTLCQPVWQCNLELV